jgi:hypothetical protein
MPGYLRCPKRGRETAIRRFGILLAAVSAAAGLVFTALPAGATQRIPHTIPDIPGGTYEFSNYNQYFTNLTGDGASAGDAIEFTPGPGDGLDSSWELRSHGHVTSSGSTFTVGSGLNSEYNNYTIWELYNAGPGLDASTCPGGDWDHSCLNTPPNNFFVIVQISGSNYYLVNVHASNEGYGETGDFQTPYLLTYQQPYYRGLYQAWLEMSGSRPSGSTITAHQLP